MRLIPSDPDVATIVSRIQDGDLDLQPNFQRGEVWSPAKKQKLIDSILREWHVPPIHIIQGLENGRDEVLDGQQRLTAIRDFLANDLKINGNLQPIDENIKALHGKKFEELPEEWKRKIKRFPIRIFNIVDYHPSEPSELFYRLNQPAALTSAEQRNSFFGKPREQIKKLVERMELAGLDKSFLGFSNSRMAYDDSLARVCVALEGGLRTKTGANLLADRYRSGQPFDQSAYMRAGNAIDLLANVRKEVQDSCKLNKASLFSWLIFFSRATTAVPQLPHRLLAQFFMYFENERGFYGSGISEIREFGPVIKELFTTYQDRVTSRVSDASSVLLRDLSIWGVFTLEKAHFSYILSPHLSSLRDHLIHADLHSKIKAGERNLLEFYSKYEAWENIQ